MKRPELPKKSKNEVHEALRGGGADLVYVDRNYKYEDVGAMRGAWHIRTSNSDKFSSDPTEFSLHCDNVVYVAYDSRATEPPSWMAEWKVERQKVRTSDGDRDMYSKFFWAGRVTLGGNEGCRTGARSMYTVLIRESAATTDEGKSEKADSDDEKERPKSSFPATKELGGEIGGGWRLIVSQEGKKKKRIWNLEEVDKCIKSGMAEWDGTALVWRPRYHWDTRRNKWAKWAGNPSSTVWKQFPRTSIRDGATVRMRFASKRDERMPKVEYDDKWHNGKENNHNLRNVGGTGDFKVGLLQTDGRPNPGSWHAWQVRIYPYLHRDAKKHIGENDSSNCSYWYRKDPGGDDCLVDDYSQEEDRDGFKKLKHKGQLKFGMGPHSPYDEYFDVEFTLKMTGDRRVSSSVKVNDDCVELDSYDHDSSSGFGRDFTHIDAICWSFNNMKPYADIKLLGVGW